MKTRRVRKKKYSKYRKISKKRNYKRRTLKKIMRGGAPPSFETKLTEIQNAAPGAIIQIPIKLYNQQVELRSTNHQQQVNETLVFKDFLKNQATMTPTPHTAPVEDLFAWQRDNLTQGALCRLWYNNENTGIELSLIGKPTLNELESDNTSKQDGDTMDIVYIFRKLPLPVPVHLPEAAAA